MKKYLLLFTLTGILLLGGIYAKRKWYDPEQAQGKAAAEVEPEKSKSGKPLLHSITNPRLVFKTKAGDSISVYDYHIYYNHTIVSDSIYDILYDSPYNRIIEQNSKVLLFIIIEDNVNFNKIQARLILPTETKVLADVAYNDSSQRNGPAPFTDIDHDGNLEFGGFDLTEDYDNPDSMYYIPSTFYEIKNGNVTKDIQLEKQMDIRENGVYIPHPYDKNGFCCVVIPKTKHKIMRNGITLKQAIELAEQFIKEQGYTEFWPQNAQLRYELFDGDIKNFKNNEDILKKRHNTLHPTAFCYSKSSNRWDIGFLSVEVSIKVLNASKRRSDLPGRAVSVSLDGKEVRIEDNDPLFSYFKKLRPR